LNLILPSVVEEMDEAEERGVKAPEEETVQQAGVMVEMAGDMALFVCNSKPVLYCMKNSHNSTKKISS
jgi:hypothetical protein